MTTTLFNLSDKVALVTGASRGNEVVADIVNAGGSAQSMACHIGEMDNIIATFEKIKEEHGKLDVLVNNAAANPYFGHILDTDLGAFNKTVDVNIRGYFFMSVEAGKLMRDNGGGSIINTASVNGLQPGVSQGIYSITKAAVINMTKSFAKECATMNIRVNAILPGLTKTKFAGELFENEKMHKMAILLD